MCLRRSTCTATVLCARLRLCGSVCARVHARTHAVWCRCGGGGGSRGMYVFKYATITHEHPPTGPCARQNFTAEVLGIDKFIKSGNKEDSKPVIYTWEPSAVPADVRPCPRCTLACVLASCTSFVAALCLKTRLKRITTSCIHCHHDTPACRYSSLHPCT